MPGSASRTLIIAIFVIPAGLLCAACAGTHHVKDSRSAERRIRPGDVIEIRFAHYPDFNQTLIVGPDGQINLQAVGQLDATAFSTEGLAIAIMRRYERILALPKVKVNVHQGEAFTVYLGGQINKPGVLRFKSEMTVTQSIIMAGGLKDTSLDYEIYVFRNRGNQGLKTFRFLLRETQSSSKAARDFRLAPYDVVFVMKAVPTLSGFGTEI